MSGLLNSLKNLASSSRAASGGDISARFSVSPSSGGEGGFAQWLHAMRLVARLPSGVPQHFRKKLWLTLADRHLTVQGIDWPTAERNCFRGTAHPEDTELGAQIVKDLHRTGCSLFCGAEGRENQAMLRRVLLAYARWNKEVGYCQGFNMLAAIILEVMEKSEADSLKVMIYLVEAVLPEGYFADDLRGLSADMAAFRDLLKIRLPRLAQHMDRLQRSSDGGGVEPPLPDVFTMQWFLTLYATWLPRGALLRIWDLVFLDGNEVLLLTALAIWDLLQDRIVSARSADEYYSCMGGGAGAVWEAGDALVARVIALDAAPELPRLRDMHRYHVSPPVPPAAPPPSAPPAAPIHSTVQSVTRRGLKLFYSEDEGDSSDEGNKMALATVTTPRREEISGGDRLSLDIGALKRQYARLRERQRQAHVILAAACARHAAVGVSTTPTSLTVNHLLLGKSAIVSSRGRRLGPPPGAVPPSRRNVTFRTPRSNTHTDDTISWKEEHHRRNVTRRDSIKWKDIKKTKNNGNSARKSSLDDEEAGDGVIVSEREADEMMSSMRSRSMSESSSYSSRSGSSTDTSLCDDNNRASDFDSEPASIGDITAESFIQAGISNSTNKNDTQVESPVLEPKHLFQPVLREEIPLVKKKSTMDIASLNIIEPPTITEYVTSTHGEQLRHYLEEFENRKNIEGSNLLSLLESPLPVTDTFKMSRDTSSKSESDIIGLRYSVEKDLTKTPEFNISSSSNAKSFVDISPAEFTASRYRVDYNSIYNDTCRLIDLLPDHSETLMYQSRPPDIIDSLTMSPNFVPDIDLSDKNLSDVDSPLRSPGAESIVVSEDEPPIPLKIDKYFEHSPEFFGARKVSGLRISDTEDIPNRRTPTRVSRLPRKPDSLMLQCNLNEKVQGKTEYESSQEICPSNFDVEIDVDRSRNLTNNLRGDYLILNEVRDIHGNNAISDIGKYKPMAKQYEKMGTIGTLESGRRNSEKALQIIQENSKILNRILTKQSAVTSHKETEDIELAARNSDLRNFKYLDNAIITAKIIESPVLKGSASDSLIKWDEPIKPSEFERNSEFSRLRPTSLDEPISPALVKKIAVTVSSSNFLKDSTQAAGKDADKNKTDLYGWENKGFLAKCNRNIDNNSRFETEPLSKVESPMYSTLSCIHPSESIQNPEYDWSVHKMDKKDITSDKSNVDFEYISKFDPLRFQSKSVDPTTDPYDPSLTSKYSDCLLSRASDICSRMLDRGPKVCENISIADDSQASDFAFVVTSSVSFSYEPSADDDSPTAAKSNSSDTLCQITSLDQISTPISPKIFPKDTANIQKENLDKFDRSMISSDDTSSQITSLIDTETVSSLSCTRSPSSGSYHPFPARPAIRMPKELGVRLGLYSRDSINSPSK